MSEKSKKNLTPLYIFFTLLFSIGITFLVLSIIIPPKKENNDKTLTTTVNTTEDKTEKSSDSSKLNVKLSKSEVEDGKYQLRVTIPEVLNETGTCELEMKSSNGDYVKRSTKTISAGPETTSCDGFDIRTDGIAAGLYDFTLTVKVGDRSGTVTGNVKI